MAQPTFKDSVYRFTDPLRYFKANDPYFFEVDNIPLKQLQENCLWLKDQVAKTAQGLLGVKRADIDELRPYANGVDRIIRVNPGRFTARINDASTKEPLSYLYKIFGGYAVPGEQWSWLRFTDAYAIATGSPGDFPGDIEHQFPGHGPYPINPSWNNLLYTALEKFKSNLAQDSMGMMGLDERITTFPTRKPNAAFNFTGINWNESGPAINWSHEQGPNGTGGVNLVPAVVTQALLWAKSDTETSWVGTTYDPPTTISWPGWSKMGLLESALIKKWRGIARNAIVDIPDEITVDIPPFDPTDFNYIDENGNEQSVEGVQSRIDMVFIYSKPIDTSSVKYLKGNAIQTLTAPALGVIRGAGLRMRYESLEAPLSENYGRRNAVDEAGNTQILAAPGDAQNANLGFTSTSANDIAYDIRGSFPAPDDILNIAPQLSEYLESNAIELVGQSILPVAYVWVQAGSNIVAVTDVIDIRPLFRTAELTYNERAGIAAALPSISLANPVATLSHMEEYNKGLWTGLTEKINEATSVQTNTGVAAMGYVYGGWYFGPEGALYDFYYQQDNGPGTHAPTAGPDNPVYKDKVTSKYAATAHAPLMPDWEVALWPAMYGMTAIGQYMVDYLTPFHSGWPYPPSGDEDASIVGGSCSQVENYVPAERAHSWRNNENASSAAKLQTRMTHTYMRKEIKFDRPAWLLDYHVDLELVNCIDQNYNGAIPPDYVAPWGKAGTYTGGWVEKGHDYFIIYWAVSADSLNAWWGAGTNASLGVYHTFIPQYSYTDGTLFTFRSNGEKLEDWAGFIVPVKDVLESNTDVIQQVDAESPPTGRTGYLGNPRAIKCALPTVMWKVTAISDTDSDYYYTGLGANNNITFNEN